MNSDEMLEQYLPEKDRLAAQEQRRQDKVFKAWLDAPMPGQAQPRQPRQPRQTGMNAGAGAGGSTVQSMTNNNISNPFSMPTVRMGGAPQQQPQPAQPQRPITLADYSPDPEQAAQLRAEAAQANAARQMNTYSPPPQPRRITLADYSPDPEQAAQLRAEAEQAEQQDALRRRGAAVEDHLPGNNDLLNQNTQGALDSLTESQRQQQEAAYIQSELLKKYLPQQLNASGLGGLGVSESAYLQANNNYQSQLGAINQDINDKKQSVLTDHRNKVMADEEKETERLRAEIWEFLGEANTSAEIDRILSQYEGKVPDTLWDELTRSAEVMKGSELIRKGDENARVEEARGEIITTGISFNKNNGRTNMKKGDNFSLELDGQKFRIQSGGKVDDQQLIDRVAHLPNNSVFGFNDQVYIKQNGNVYLIERRPMIRNNVDHGYNTLFDKVFG